MEAKNLNIIKTLLLLGAISAPSFYLLSSYYRPTDKRRYVRRVRRVIPVASEEKVEQTPIVAKQIPIEPNENIEIAQPAQTIPAISGEQNVQMPVAMPSQSILSALYATIAPVILVSLNTALGTGIAASTKSIIKQFMTRQAFISFKDNALDLVNAELKEANLTMSDENKIKAANIILLQNKINADQMEKSTTLSAILGQGLYVGILYTIVQTIGSLFGLGATMGLQTLMPSK